MKKILSTMHAAILLTILGGNVLLSSCSDEYSGEMMASLEPLTVEVDNAEIEFNFNGGSQTVSVKSGLNWTAKTNDAWLEVSPSSGKDANVTISATPNNAKTERSGRVTIGSKTITVKQGAEILNVSSKVVSIPESGGSIALNIESNTSWTISQKKDWFTVSTTQGSGSATVNISADKNDGTIREGILYVETSDGLFQETIEVEQEGVGAANVNEFAPFSVDGGSVEYSPSKLVFSNWKATVESGVSWIHVSPAQGGSSSTLSIKVDKTTSSKDRSSYVELTYDNGARYRLVVNQYGAGIVCGTARYNFFAKGGTSEPISVDANGEVSVTKSASWFTTNWDGSNLTITATENISSEKRQGKVTLTLVGSDKSVSIEVYQASQHGDFVISGYDADKDLLHVGPEAVDLGLSVKWATFNVGARAPEEYGDYFAWGEIEPKSTYDWVTYKWCNGSYNTMTKYCRGSYYGTVDNKTTLDPEDDVAHVKLGGSWRMPTEAEQDELCTKCTWTWTTQNGVNGYKVTSKTNGNSIFLPAAGYRYFSGLYDVGSWGVYWSSSLSSGYSYAAYRVLFDSDYVDRLNYSNRYYGHSVRAVCP